MNQRGGTVLLVTGRSLLVDVGRFRGVRGEAGKDTSQLGGPVAERDAVIVGSMPITFGLSPTASMSVTAVSMAVLVAALWYGARESRV